jgi:hypothetical protein
MTHVNIDRTVRSIYLESWMHRRLPVVERGSDAADWSKGPGL